MLFLLWLSTTVGEGRLWERLRIYSGKYLFNKSKFYLDRFLSLESQIRQQLTNIKQQIFYRSTSFRFSFIFRYFKVFQVKRIVYI
jgi:hypothetical protein